MEAMIWTLLGYLAMPMFFVVGFGVTAIFACIVMDILSLETLESP